MSDATDMLSLLTQRAAIVKQIAAGGASKRTLTMTLPCSRSTITRALQDLTIAQLVQKDGNNYELTLHGKIAYRDFCQVIDRYNGLATAASLLDHLPETAAIPSVIFEDVTVIRPSSTIPDAPRIQFVDRIRQSKEVVGVGSILTQHLVEVFRDQLIEDDLQTTLILDEQVVEHLRNTYQKTFDTALETDHCTLQSIEQPPPFSLTIVDWTELWLGIYNEYGQLQGMLQTESPAAVRWAEQRLGQYTERATLVCRRGTITGTKKQQSP